MKRKAAFYLALVFIFGLMPQGSYASAGSRPRLQNPVTEIYSVVDQSAIGSESAYDFLINWALPDQAAVDSSAVSGSENATLFEMDYRNATLGETAEIFEEGEYEVPDGSNAQRFENAISATLDPGSLYEFRFIPSHINQVRAVENGVEITRPVDVTADPAKGTSILVLTDLEVDVLGAGNKLTVSWSDPNPAGQNVFDGYEIGYKVSDNMGFTQFVYVAADDETLTSEDGRFSYVLTDNSLEAGLTYDVRVEPMYKGNVVRNTDDSKSVRKITADLGGGSKDYFLAFRNPQDFEYRKDNVLILPYLDYVRIADSQIRLFWSSLAKLGTTANMLDHLVVEQLNPETGEVIKDALYFNGSYFIDNLNEAIVDLPKPLDTEKAYRLAIYFEGQDEPQYTNIVIVEPNYVPFGPYAPEIKNLQANEQEQALEDLQWLAFARKPLNPDSGEEVVYEKYDYNTIDTQLIYEVYIADNRTALNGIENVQEPIVSLGSPVTTDPIDFFNIDENGVPVNPPQPTYIEETITSYYAQRTDGSIELREELDGNKWYYVKIIAVRDNRAGEKSNPAYYEVFMPPFTGLEVNPVMIDAPPLKVTETAPDGSSITVQWDTKYLEIQNPLTKTWHSVIGVSSTTPGAIYGKTAMDVEAIQDADGKALIINDIVKKNSTLLAMLEDLDISATGSDYPKDLNNLLNAARPLVADELAGMGVTGDINLRVVDLSRADFDLHTVENTAMRSAGGYVPYLSAITEWNRVEVTKNEAGMNPLTITTTITESNNPAGPIEENQTYVIYVRPVEVRGGELVSYLPNYVISTTEQTKPRPPADPTSPVLFPDQAFSNALRFYWPLTGFAGMEYEIRYTDRASDYPDTFVGELSWEDLSDAVEVGKGKAEHKNADKDSDYYKLEGLLPLTQYYIWIRARSVNSDGENEEASDWSDWSNYLNMRTLDFDAPNPPSPQLANTTYMTLYNKLNSTAYANVEANAFSIQWRIVAGDSLPLAAAGVAKANTTAANLVMNPELTDLQSYLVRFSGLEANRDYYVRAKTVKTVAKDTKDVYSYVIQVSQDDAFEIEADTLEFTIPAIPAAGAIPSKESDWVMLPQNPITTRPSGSGIGDINPDLYPMPDTDWDITYDNGKLKFRFRTDQMGSNGQLDQNADQRFISRLVNDRTFNYEIDLSRDAQNRPITSREVELPYTIMQAFDERKITLELKTGEYDLSIPPGSFNTSEVRAAQMGKGSNLTINLSGEPTGMPDLGTGEMFTSEPQKLTARVNTPSRSINVVTFAKPLGITHSMEGHTSPEGSNASIAFATADTGTWGMLPARYSYADNALTGNITRAGAFAAVTREVPSSAVPAELDSTFDAMRRVTSRISITDMSQYNAVESVSAGKFNKTSTALGAQMSASESSALSKAGLLTDGSLTREAAMSAMVKLYELKTKQVLTPMTTAEALPGVETASPAYRRNLLKAADLGFVTGDLNPGGNVTMGDMMNMADIVLTDAN